MKSGGKSKGAGKKNVRRDSLFLVAGAVTLTCGVVCSLVESFVLKPTPTRWLMQGTGKSLGKLFFQATGQGVGFTPPEWLAWTCLSLGGALFVHGVINVVKKG